MLGVVEDAAQRARGKLNSAGDRPMSVVLVSKMAFPGDSIQKFGDSCDEFIRCPVD